MSHLLVTIDVECDKSTRWHIARPLAFRAVTEAMPDRLQPLFDRCGVRPTWLLSPEVLADDVSMATLTALPNGELGTHLHPELIGPGPVVDPATGPVTDAMQGDCAPAVERAKLEALTDRFIARTGRRPTAFRAGRFGVGRASGRWLAELGYRVDSSVTPHLAWTNAAGEARPDFRGCPERPYRVGDDLFTPGAGPLWEVPVTVLAPDALPGARPMWPGATSGAPVWFRPWYADAETLRAIVRRVAAERDGPAPPRPLVMMFHNVELLANASPYTRSEADVQRYLDLVERACVAALDAGFAPATLTEYAAWLDEHGGEQT